MAARSNAVSVKGGYNQLRYPGKTVVYCLYPESLEAMDVKLDSRVDKMLDLGLLAELEAFWKENDDATFDTSKGIVQAIGFKDWIPYLSMDRSQQQEQESVKQECMESMKLYTRKYARRQIKWIRSQITSRAALMTDLRAWCVRFSSESFQESVIKPAIKHFRKISLGQPEDEEVDDNSSELPPILISNNCLQAMAADKIQRHHCPLCPDTFIYGDESMLRKHEQCRKHRRNLKKSLRPERKVTIK